MIRVSAQDRLDSALAEARGSGARLAFVPTMGYLHEGHLSLIDAARERADFVVLSIFVNPLQFGPSEDLARYPRDLERDARMAAERGADLLYTPAEADMYADGAQAIFVTAPDLEDRLCGAFRPGHFRGVLTVVAKLFQRVRPDVAVFGQKDYQQYMLVRRMARELDFPIEVVAAPIVRDPDGLALSSRNVYLSAQERRAALQISAALGEVERRFASGEADAATLLAAARDLLDAERLLRPQYVELVDPHTLQPVQRARPGAVCAIAAFAGATRLIDNRALVVP